LGRSEAILAQIAHAVLETFTTPVSWNSLVQKTSVGSHHTVGDYLEVLAHNFVLFFVPHYDPNTRRANLRKNRKIYFADTFIWHTFNWWVRRSTLPFDLAQAALNDPSIKGELVENLVGSFLWRRGDMPCYWHDRSQNEIDFLIHEGNRPFGVEVKFREQISGKELKALEKFRNGVVLTKRRLEPGDPFPFVPVCLYLLN
jgi:predicted AAA+ superfamily ATPase